MLHGVTNAIEKVFSSVCRMPYPAWCSEHFYEIMKDCSEEEAEAKPSFEMLQWRLEDTFYINDVDAVLYVACVLLIHASYIVSCTGMTVQ